MPTLSLNLHYTWKPVEAAPGRPYRYPKELPEAAREALDVPAIYRWNLFDDEPGDQRTYSFGETDSLARRLYAYRNPGSEKGDVVKVKAKLVEAVTFGTAAQLEMLLLDPFDLGGKQMSQAGLRNRNLRKMLLALFITLHESAGDTVWNLQSAPDPRDLLR